MKLDYELDDVFLVFVDSILSLLFFLAVVERFGSGLEFPDFRFACRLFVDALILGNFALCLEDLISDVSAEESLALVFASEHFNFFRIRIMKIDFLTD